MVAKGLSWDAWLALKGQELIFPGINGRRLRTDRINKYLNKYALVNGLSTSEIKGHSLRIGSTTDLARNQASDRTIQANGRWHSDGFHPYVRYDAQLRRNVRRKFLH